MRIRTIAILTVLTVLLPPDLAGAVGAGAVALTFNTSARAEGMGGAGVAGVWGGDTDLWANPALLAFRPGVRYGTMHSKLAEGIADDIFIDKQELTFGWRGIGVLYAESPFENVDLEFGEQTLTDESGNVVGTFRPYEKSHAWGVGAGLTQVLDGFAGTDLNRWFDLAGGVVWRRFEDRISPDVFAGGNGGAKASSRDLGWVARLTPLDTQAMASPLADLPVGLRVEGTYGRAKQNDTDEYLVHYDISQADPMPTAYVSGWAVHTEITAGGGFAAALPTLVRDAVTSLFAWTYSEQTIEPGYVWDPATSTYHYEHDTSGLYDVCSRGHELSFMNVFFLRRGHYTDTVGDVDDITKGWGLNVPVGRFGGVRYDEATVPQAQTLPTVKRTGWHVWVDVAAILGLR